MMIHIYDGFCPDELQPDSRDPNCPACQVEAERDQLRAENALLCTKLAESVTAYSEEHEVACAMFSVIAEIAAIVGVKDSSPEISKKTVEGVKRLCTENARLRQILVDVCNSTGGACTEDVSVGFLAHLPGEVEAMAKKNARLDQALADTAAQLTDAVQRAQEAEYNLRLMTKQTDAFHAENGRLRQQQERITTIARPYNGGLDCEGDGSGPGCKNRAVWEIQDMQEDGSNYVYVCADHLSDYQRWAAGDGRLPLVFENSFDI